MRSIEKKGEILLQAHCLQLVQQLQREAHLWKEYTQAQLSKRGPYPNRTTNPYWGTTGKLRKSMHYEVRNNCKSKKKPPYTINVMNQWDVLMSRGKDYSKVLNQWTGKPFAGFRDRADAMFKKHTREIMMGRV